MAVLEITPAERIRELNDISASLTETLRHMSQAINALSPTAPNQENSVDARTEVFDEHSRAAYVGIQAFNAKMKRQAYALEEAGIIAAEAPTIVTVNPLQREISNASSTAGVEKITNGGLGNFDVGWLNSRGNKVGMEKEAELMQEARGLLETELKKRGDGAVVE
ncbi:hypothetical protein BAUCODRAFT_367515 [Baudoinia panamericana UAMH 10762]|uniref:Mediator of RNA polymerase II transcription subunit 11 n=1 Tax=Baudoinia panamericana (strain UAMH 10762) TaxID=717646 RepID=M2LZP6_BAUPA|nr:uncharacterized protein BAUCODRAFT_367515 [Baudoinia panamericana UAMH 10762]EMD00178.1 hypothetical protein BAUCODRAFT_367515 [Baudoinia panamericana UAMH 10762]